MFNFIAFFKRLCFMYLPSYVWDVLKNTVFISGQGLLHSHVKQGILPFPKEQQDGKFLYFNQITYSLKGSGIYWNLEWPTGFFCSGQPRKEGITFCLALLVVQNHQSSWALHLQCSQGLIFSSLCNRFFICLHGSLRPECILS